MGRILKAHCSNCGYESGILMADAGRFNWTTYYGVPALCYVERTVVTVNTRIQQLIEGVEQENIGFGTAAMQEGDQDEAARSVAPGSEHERSSAEQDEPPREYPEPVPLEEAGVGGYAAEDYSVGETLDTIRRDFLAPPPAPMPPQGADVDEEPSAAEFGHVVEEATSGQGAGGRGQGAGDGGERAEASGQRAGDERRASVGISPSAEAGEQWPAEQGEDPGPVEGSSARYGMEAREYFPAEREEDMGPATEQYEDEPGPGGRKILHGPWTLKSDEGRESGAEERAGERAVPASERRTSFGLVAVPVEPRTTMPLTAGDEPGAMSAAEARSLELTTGTAPEQPAESVAAYPCPNDGSGTVLYEVQAQDLDKAQACPRCGEQALAFSVEGHWD